MSLGSYVLIKELVVAKSVLLHGISHSMSKDPLSRIIAILHFDYFVEAVLKAFLRAENISTSKLSKMNLFELLKEADKLWKIKFKESLPFRYEIGGLRKLRDQVQHEAHIPSIEDVERYRVIIKDFAYKIFEKEFNLKFDEVSLSDLIEDSELRQDIKVVEKIINEGEYKEALERLNRVLEKIIFSKSRVFEQAGALAGHLLGESFIKLINEYEFKKLVDEIHDNNIKEMLTIMRNAVIELGMTATTLQFLNDLKVSFLRHMERYRKLETGTYEPTEDEVLDSLNFTRSLIIKWQELGLLRENQ